ncbi:hypothetical protein LX77_02393 [Gelidibacter algens]|uniref:Uncharacterized protein n=1 Tax=Gelidibacter algens TaxID=49280 RepID=A0A327S1B3_9FLAO|nr:hypothetical protein LX77_02393 [Gelidibacter algens]
MFYMNEFTTTVLNNSNNNNKSINALSLPYYNDAFIYLGVCVAEGATHRALAPHFSQSPPAPVKEFKQGAPSLTRPGQHL